MTEELVSFEVAKLAKEKGFGPEEEWSPTCAVGYIDYNVLEGESKKGVVLEELPEEEFHCEGHYLAPTQSLLQRWLREVHKIVLYVIPVNYNKYGYMVKGMLRLGVLDDNKLIVNEFADTYEKALETGLKLALETIKT